MEYVIVIGAAIGIAYVAVVSERRARAKGKRRRGGLAGAFGAIDAAFRPATAEASTIQEAETRMPAPAPLAGDPGPGRTDEKVGTGDKTNPDHKTRTYEK